MFDKQQYYYLPMVNFRLEHLLNHWVLLAINILILIVVEATGSFFAMNGLIHLIAVLFVGLGLTRLWTHRDVYDRFLEPLIHFSIFALLILAGSHVAEYFSFRSQHLTHQSIVTNVVNAYMISFLLIIIGTESFLKVLHSRSKIILIISSLAICIFSGLFLIFIFQPQLINLHADSLALYAYITFILLTSGFSSWRLMVLRRHVHIMKNFIEYLIAAIFLICCVALLSILEEVIVALGVPFIQIVYISHFLFYGALSLIFLAFERLMHLEGIYAELRDK